MVCLCGSAPSSELSDSTSVVLAEVELDESSSYPAVGLTGCLLPYKPFPCPLPFPAGRFPPHPRRGRPLCLFACGDSDEERKEGIELTWGSLLAAWLGLDIVDGSNDVRTGRRASVRGQGKGDAGDAMCALAS